MSLTHTPKLYVGTYSKYNNGSSQGAWLDLDDYTDAEHFYEACASLHADEEDPEFMFKYFEGFPEDLYSESGNVEEIYEYIDFCESSCLDQDAIDAGLELDIPLESIEDAYQGQYDSDEDFAEQLAEEMGAVNKEATWPNNYIDWEAAARDLMQDYSASNGYYFSNKW